MYPLYHVNIHVSAPTDNRNNDPYGIAGVQSFTVYILVPPWLQHTLGPLRLLKAQSNSTKLHLKCNKSWLKKGKWSKRELGQASQKQAKEMLSEDGGRTYIRWEVSFWAQRGGTSPFFLPFSWGPSSLRCLAKAGCKRNREFLFMIFFWWFGVSGILSHWGLLLEARKLLRFLIHSS